MFPLFLNNKKFGQSIRTLTDTEIHVAHGLESGEKRKVWLVSG